MNRPTSLLLILLVFESTQARATEPDLGTGACVTQSIDRILLLQLKKAEIEASLTRLRKAQESVDLEIDQAWSEFHSEPFKNTTVTQHDRTQARVELGLMEDERLAKYQDQLQEHAMEAKAKAELGRESAVSLTAPHDMSELKLILHPLYQGKVLQRALFENMYLAELTPENIERGAFWGKFAILDVLGPWTGPIEAQAKTLRSEVGGMNQAQALELAKFLRASKGRNLVDIEVALKDLMLDRETAYEGIRHGFLAKTLSPKKRFYSAASIGLPPRVITEELLGTPQNKTRHLNSELRYHSDLELHILLEKFDRTELLSAALDQFLFRLHFQTLDFLETSGYFNRDDTRLEPAAKLRALQRWSDLYVLEKARQAGGKAWEEARPVALAMDHALGFEPGTYLDLKAPGDPNTLEYWTVQRAQAQRTKAVDPFAGEPVKNLMLRSILQQKILSLPIHEFEKFKPNYEYQFSEGLRSRKELYETLVKYAVKAKEGGLGKSYFDWLGNMAKWFYESENYRLARDPVYDEKLKHLAEKCLSFGLEKPRN